MRRRFRELEKCETFTDRTVNGRAASPDQRCAEDIMVVSANLGLIDYWRGVGQQVAHKDVADSSISCNACLWTGRRGRVELGLKHGINVLLAA